MRVPEGARSSREYEAARGLLARVDYALDDLRTNESRACAAVLASGPGVGLPTLRDIPPRPSTSSVSRIHHHPC